MKKIIISIFIVSLFVKNVFAGGMMNIPVELIELDNQGRALFIKNALTATQLNGEKEVIYVELISTIIGGDEDGADFTGAYFVYTVRIQALNKKFSCEQFLSVGNFDPSLTKPVHCELL